MKIFNFIDNERVQPSTGHFLETIDPSRGEPHGELADSDAKDIDVAVASAKKAFKTWSRTSVQERARVMYKIADLIDERRFDFAEAESLDQGKPVWLAESMDIMRVAHNFRFFAGVILHEVDHAARIEAGVLNYVSHKPIGVAGLISPWNLPLYLLTWKIAPAIAYGNTCVCKPSELTSLTASLLCDVLIEAGLPKGVVNMVFGTGPRAGAALVAHPEVPLISFTGGTATGKAIAGVAAPMFKKLSLELGGKNPTLIFADADLEHCIEKIVRSSFLNQGEICLCGSRIYVERTIFDKFEKMFVDEVKKLKVGDPRDRDTQIGALVSREHLAKVESYVQLARVEGAEILTGGQRPKLSGELAGGFFYEPTIILGVAQRSRVQQEEIFGPVVTISAFQNEKDAVELANDIKYGLSATVWTQSLSRAHRVAEELEAGTVWVNTWMLRDLRMPFGGVKASGLGREGQFASREFFTEAKTICINHG